MTNIPFKKVLPEIAAIGFGLIVSILIIHIMQFINGALYPVGEGVRLAEPAVYERFIRENPLFLMGVLFSNMTGCFTGGALARLIQPDLPVRFAGWVGAVLLGLEIYNLVWVAYPVWFWFLTLLIYLPAAWAGAWFIKFYRTAN